MRQWPGSLIRKASTTWILLLAATGWGFCQNQAPTITSLSPPSAAAGGPGFTLTVYGTDFAYGAVVQWNGSNRRTDQPFDNTTLYATILASDIASVGTVTVTVVNPGPGGGISNPVTFTILNKNPAPTLNSISPDTFPVGGDGVMLTVQGSNFGGSSTVRWNGSDRSTSYISSTLLSAYIPASDITALGKAEVTVFNPAPGGGVSESQLFFITPNPKPAITFLDPSQPAASGPSFTLNVYGSNFVKGSTVRWNGSDRLTSTVWAAAGQLFATIPSSDIASVGTNTVTVFNPSPGGGISNEVTISVTSNPTPTISSLSPGSALAGGEDFTLNVHGANFVPGSRIRWNGSDRETDFRDSEYMMAAIPASEIASPGTAFVTVFNPAPGGGVSNLAQFAINSANPLPTITSLVPISATAGGPSFGLMVRGNSFAQGAKIRWDNTELNTTFAGADLLYAIIPAATIAAAGQASVRVVNPVPGGGLSNALTFTINASNPKPTITTLRPNSAAAGDASGPWLVVGSNFAEGARVRWNGSDRTTYPGSSDGTGLDYYPLASDVATMGTASVSVFNPAPGGGASNSMLFTVTTSNPNPATTSISPNTVSAAQQSVVAIKGSGFQTGARVSIGGVMVPVSSVDPNQIMVTTIAGSIPGTYDVMVLNPDGGRAVFSNGFAYTAVTPIIRQLVPDRKLEGEDPFQLDVHGEDFTQGTMVYWGGSSRVTRTIDSSHLKASISTFDIMKTKTVPVQVSPNGSIFSNSLPFVIEANNSLQFVVDRVLPVEGSTQGNTRIRIIGQNFNPSLAFGQSSIAGPLGGGMLATDKEGQFEVLVGNKPATDVTFVSQTEIDATTPAHTAGKADVVVAVNSSTQSKARDPFNYKDMLPTQPPLAGKSRIRIPFVVDTKEFRTNLGINNLGNTEAQVELQLVNRNGETELRKSARIPARGMTQFNNVVRVLEGVADDQLTGREGYLIVDSNFPVEAWASQIDNRTEDSSIEQGRRELAAEQIIIPSSSSFDPYRTSLVVINESQTAGRVEIRARDASGKTLAVLSELEIRANGYLYYEDIHRGLGLSNVYGPIEITATGGIKISATARVYTHQGTSGYFEGVDSALASREVILPYTQESMDFRTNLGITNPGEQQANVTVSLVDANGQVRSSRAYTTSPHGLRQVNRVNRELGWVGEGYLRLKSDQPIIGWTSQIDHLSQDLSLVAGKANKAASLLIPSSSGTAKFRSTLVIVNQDSTETTVQVTAWDTAGNAKGSARLTIPGYGMSSDNDILGRLGLDDSYGPLEIESLDGNSILAISRVYSQLRTGGYFEGVPIGF